MRHPVRRKAKASGLRKADPFEAPLEARGKEPELHEPANSGSLPTWSESSIAALGNGCAPWNFVATTCCLPLSSIMEAPKKPSLCMRNSEGRPSYSLISALCPGMSGSRLGMGSQYRVETCRSFQTLPWFAVGEE